MAHIRPLLFDDLANTLEAVDLLVLNKNFPWTVLRETLSKLGSDPGFVLGLDMPSLELDRLDQCHNLPLPDFDETGWVGRQRELEDVVKQCKGPYPVISILGEGGLGKTALAVKAAYELLDDPEHPFDAIVWSTSKTSQLTASEIVRIENAITDSLGLLAGIAKQLAGQSAKDPLEEILHYLKEFRVLVILDNLETVLDDRIRTFVQNMPSGSKLLITSRVGLGAYEFPYTIKPMGEREAVQLLRAAMKARGLETVLGNDSNTLASYCSRMHNSPGYIKWFVSAIAAGQRPEEILAHPGLFLEFCMSNVYENLEAQAKTILSAMLAVPGSHSQAELAFITAIEILSLQKGLQQLLATSFVAMSTEKRENSVTTKYGIGDMARDYLLAHHQPEPLASQKFMKRKRQLIAEAEKWTGPNTLRRFSWDELHIRTKDDLVTARFLREAMKAAKNGDTKGADEAIGWARKLAPDYFEVARVTATVRTMQDNLAAAREAYEAAIELAPTHIPLRHWYGVFLFQSQNDLDEAEHQLRAGLAIESDCLELQLEMARVLLYQQKFDEASEYVMKLKAVPALSVRNLVRTFDLSIQIEYRKADLASIAGEIEEAMAHLAHLIEAYEGVPSDFRDNTMRNRLLKARVTMANCDALVTTELQSMKLRVLRERMEELIGDRAVPSTLDSIFADSIPEMRGRIESKLDDRFGFIVEPGGNKIYFNKRDVMPKTAWSKLQPGSPVGYRTVMTPKGRAAVCVKPLSAEDLIRGLE